MKGYDAGKKVSGIKRHIAVDTQGLPHAVAVTTAEVTDRKGAPQTQPHTGAKHWVVERRFAWLEKNRRLWKNCKRWLNTSLQFIHLAFLALLLERLGTRSKADFEKTMVLGKNYKLPL